MAPVETVSLLRDGIAAARAGDKARTRTLLRQVTELEPNNELAWLWLANTAEDPRESLACLRRVMEVNPGNEYAAAGLPDALCRAGVVAAKANERMQAKIWFAEATDLAPRNETAWLWRAGLADTAEEGVELLQFVLAINPANERAKQGLAHYQAQMAPRFACPLCDFQGEPGKNPHACPRCRSVVSIENPAAFDAPTGADRRMLETAAHKIYADLQADPSSMNAYKLGLSYLNLGYIDEGIKALQTAIKARPADAAWRNQVNRFVKHREAVRKTADEERRRLIPASKPTIMIVDDSPTIRKLVSVTLGTVGYQVVEAADGYEVAERIRQQGAPQLFLLDINMPGLDGYQLCKMLRQNAETSKVPIIFLTGKDGFLNKLRGQWAGAVEYLTKPFDPQKLLAAVGKIVPLQKAPA
ncbi:response regulator [Limnoglobus roseus]|uniref:Response regulator n=1 Tax=Limnoglobus roseus TaxID=2598579 RepID=A0A5C1A872_9BACT|nr:response regulator [Limnoglobus roseus]QEL15411.1 response regulator [Limnoglobus roseus]